ncbi:TetR family transcriptional regulator [Actinotalea ferrariae CF5-4]|uniref:TetR family transcriptional regulator n=1 Tax=Actinotalea ferrariae CF5-4 TaxID=948458 RepID=A0A021VTD0_9CELL|nr:TetR/AcrR family transcriptional regulator [Actinotalea ferrariae]EYR64368.1 TetR family transcriptional regulator [Actinotalea ferrariae CF5-4]
MSKGAEAGAGVVARRGRPARYSQDDLVAVVAQVFLERGYDATSMADLARASGLTKSTFYHHVSGKEQLLRLAVSRALDALDGVFEEEARLDDSPVHRLERVLRRTTEVLLAELPYVTLLLRLRGNTEVEREALERRRSVDARLAQLVQDARAAGQIRSDLEPRLVTRLLFGMVNSLVEWYRPDGSGASGVGHGSRDDEIVHAVVELALDGLHARRG